MIVHVTQNKKQYIDLLLLADEQESMIDKYLERGDMFALFIDKKVEGVCIVTNEGDRVIELKNIAISPTSQRKGYGRELIKYVEEKYKDDFDIMIVGTGESVLTIPFYESCGFIEFNRIKNFFIDNYDHPIFEDDIQLTDMIYLRKSLKD